jgi:hypothetical protein
MHPTPTQPRDDARYELARERVLLRQRALSYLLIFLFLSLVWYVTARPGAPFWPLYAGFGLGIGLVVRFTRYYLLPGAGSVEREYERLRRSQA